MKCVCPMGGDRTCPDDCPLAKWESLPPAKRTAAERKPVAEALYKDGFTMERIATQLSVSEATIHRDLNSFTMKESKPTKTASNPKGAGRPKGSTLKPERRINTSIVAQRAAGSILDEGKSYVAAVKETGLSQTVLRSAVAREEGRREPQIERSDLSMTAQQKFDAAIRQEKAKLQASFSTAVDTRVQQLLLDTILPRHRKEQEEAKRVMNARRGVMDKATFNAIRRCLHPDSRSSVSDKMLATAFDAFMALEKRLLDEKGSPTTYQALPQTAAEWDEAKRKAAAARRTKRANGQANAATRA